MQSSIKKLLLTPHPESLFTTSPIIIESCFRLKYLKALGVIEVPQPAKTVVEKKQYNSDGCSKVTLQHLTLEYKTKKKIVQAAIKGCYDTYTCYVK